MNKWLRTAIVFGLGLALAFAGTVSALSSADYAGLWFRDDDRSDDPQPKIEETVRGLIEKGSKGQSTAADVDPQVVRRIRGVIGSFVQFADELEIESSARELVIDDGGERIKIYYLDAKKHERQMPDGTRLETTASAVGSQIDVYMKTEHGAKIYETYRLADDGSALILSVRLEDKQLKEPLVIKSIYTRAE